MRPAGRQLGIGCLLLAAMAGGSTLQLTGSDFSAPVSGLVPLQLSLSGANPEVAFVLLLINGRPARLSQRLPLTHPWDTTGLLDGTHRLEAFCYRDEATVLAEAEWLVTVDNGRGPLRSPAVPARASSLSPPLRALVASALTANPGPAGAPPIRESYGPPEPRPATTAEPDWVLPEPPPGQVQAAATPRPAVDVPWQEPPSDPIAAVPPPPPAPATPVTPPASPQPFHTTGAVPTLPSLPTLDGVETIRPPAAPPAPATSQAVRLPRREGDEPCGLVLTVYGGQRTTAGEGILRDGLAYAPLRWVFESLGGEVTWQAGRLAVRLGRQQLSLAVGSQEATVDQRAVTLTAPPVLDGSVVLLPVRAVAELLPARLVWDDLQRMVHLTVKIERQEQ